MTVSSTTFAFLAQGVLVYINDKLIKYWSANGLIIASLWTCFYNKKPQKIAVFLGDAVSKLLRWVEQMRFNLNMKAELRKRRECYLVSVGVSLKSSVCADITVSSCDRYYLWVYCLTCRYRKSTCGFYSNHYCIWNKYYIIMHIYYIQTMVRKARNNCNVVYK